MSAKSLGRPIQLCPVITGAFIDCQGPECWKVSKWNVLHRALYNPNTLHWMSFHEKALLNSEAIWVSKGLFQYWPQVNINYNYNCLKWIMKIVVQILSYESPGARMFLWLTSGVSPAVRTWLIATAISVGLKGSKGCADWDLYCTGDPADSSQ